MTRFLASLFFGSILIPFLFAPSLIHAQTWRQEMQVLTSIEYGTPIHVFLDSLSAQLERNPTFKTRRSVDDAEPMSYSALRTALYDDGFDLRSASHVFLRYRFTLGSQGFGVTETLEEMYFIFRLDDATVDIPIVHLDSRDPLVHALLVDRGISSPVNMESIRPFREFMAFPLVRAGTETAIVEIGRKALREEVGPQYKNLINFLNGQEPGGYALKTSYRPLPLVNATDVTSGPEATAAVLP